MRLLALAVLTTLLTVSVAFADASTTVDLTPAVNQLTSIVVDIGVGVVSVLALWLARKLHEKWGIDIEAQVRTIEANHRDALHSAVQTQVDAVVAKLGPNIKIDVGSPLAKQIVDGVVKSVPDAVAALKPSEQWIIDKATGLLAIAPIVP